MKSTALQGKKYFFVFNQNNSDENHRYIGKKLKISKKIKKILAQKIIKNNIIVMKNHRYVGEKTINKLEKC